MKYYCSVSVSAMRKEACDTSEMISQLLFGEKVEILNQSEGFAWVQSLNDGVEAWVQLSHLKKMESDGDTTHCSIDYYKNLYTTDGDVLLSIGAECEEDLIEISNFEDFLRGFLNVPYLSGGKSFFGLDASAFVQLAFKAKGISLKRFAHQQMETGQVLNFIQESVLGDLAFFENEFGTISHVGIMLSESEIIHCNEKVRIDQIDGFGIYDPIKKIYPYKLRLIKRIL